MKSLNWCIIQEFIIKKRVPKREKYYGSPCILHITEVKNALKNKQKQTMHNTYIYFPYAIYI